MKQQKQTGFAHLLALSILSIVLIVGFVGYRVMSSQSETQSSRHTNKSTGAKSAVNDAAAQESSLQPVEVKSSDPTPTTTKPTASTKKPSSSTTKTPTTPAPQKRVITFTKGGGSLQGDYVVVSANLSEAQSGTCTYSFSLNGTVRVKETGPVSNGNVCSKSIPASSFPKSGNYSFSLTFVSSDGLVSATQIPYDIEVI